MGCRGLNLSRSHGRMFASAESPTRSELMVDIGGNRKSEGAGGRSLALAWGAQGYRRGDTRGIGNCSPRMCAAHHVSGAVPVAPSTNYATIYFMTAALACGPSGAPQTKNGQTENGRRLGHASDRLRAPLANGALRYPSGREPSSEPREEGRVGGRAVLRLPCCLVFFAARRLIARLRSCLLAAVPHTRGGAQEGR